VSKNAAFAIALATEMFIQHLATTTHNVVKTERKPRRNIQYRDVSSAIAKTDNLEFAVDVVPKTTTFKEAKKRNKEREEREKAQEKEINDKDDAQTILLDEKVQGEENEVIVDDRPIADAEEATPNPDITPPSSSSSPALPAPEPEPTPGDAMDVDERVENNEPEDDPAAMQLEMEMRGPPRPVTKSPAARRSTGGFTSINGAK
jgi:DNA polymerase epsilon subunit 4